MAIGKARFRRCHRLAAFCLGVLLATAIGAVGLSPARAVEIRASVALPPTHPVVAGGWDAFQQAIAAQSNAALSIRLFVDGAMVGSDRALKALSQGEIDMGFLATPDYPEEFPYAAFVAAFSMIGKNGPAAAAAASELVLLNCPACRDEFTQRNLVFLGTYSAAPYLLMSREPFEKADSLAGRRIWSPGTPWDGFLREMVAAPTRTERTPAEALATGAADGVIDVAIALLHPRFAQQVRTVTLLPLGAYRGASPFTLNREFWRKLTDRQRKAILDAAPAGLIAASLAYERQAKAALDSAQERGVTMLSPDAALVARIDEVSHNTMTRLSGNPQARLGVTGAADLLEAYRGLYAKYVGLFAAAPNPNGAVDILRREIFAKLDPSEYAIASDSVAETGDQGSRDAGTREVGKLE